MYRMFCSTTICHQSFAGMLARMRSCAAKHTQPANSHCSQVRLLLLLLPCTRTNVSGLLLGTIAEWEDRLERDSTRPGTSRTAHHQVAWWYERSPERAPIRPSICCSMHPHSSSDRPYLAAASPEWQAHRTRRLLDLHVYDDPLMQALVRVSNVCCTGPQSANLTAALPPA